MGEEVMFQKILVPISSEYFSPAVFQISGLLAAASGGSVASVYVYEKRSYDEMEHLSDTYLSYYDKEEAERGRRVGHLRHAEQVVFENAKAFFKKRNIPFEYRFREGVLVDVINEEVAMHHFDLILMGFEKECGFDYRLLSEVSVPLWIEAGKGDRSVLAVCSNLAPNIKVPEMSMRLAALLGWSLHMIYIIDTEDAVEVEADGLRRVQQPVSELMKKADAFVGSMRQKGVFVELVAGAFEKETLKAAERVGAGVIIIGREQKQKGVLGLPMKGGKKKVLQHCKCSLLFLN
jgi:nucleotide-binding universal stress UspA family protein